VILLPSRYSWRSYGTPVVLTGARTGEKNIKVGNQARERTLIAILLASSVVFSGAQSVPSQSSPNIGKAAPVTAKPAGASQSTTPAQAVNSAKPGAPAGGAAPAWRGAQLNGLSRKADMYYEGVWGVSDLHVKVAESGELIRFNYRVLDPQKAAALNNKKVGPALFDAQARVQLAVPQVQNVGKLRQSSTPKAGMVY
jgi:hypothetical protein